MNLHFFFEHKSKEIMSSAFLATILEQRPDIRSAFLDLIAEPIDLELAQELKKKEWTVRVEEDRVDLWLGTTDSSWSVIIENKIQAGSFQSGQLSQYYKEHIKTRINTRVLVIYLTPGTGLGNNEISALTCLNEFTSRGCDFALRVSWDSMPESLLTVPIKGTWGQFVLSGFELILDAIDRAARQKFPNVGDRKLIYEVASEVREQLLKTNSTIKIGKPWFAKNFFTLGTHKTAVTMRLNFIFETAEEPPYNPINLFIDNKVRLTIESRLNLSKAAKPTIELKSRWQQLISSGEVEIPGVGVHQLDGHWLVAKRQLMAHTPNLVD